MDAGVIAKIKGKLRTQYGAWVVALTRAQLGAGVRPEEVQVPADVPTCKENLFKWLSAAVDMLNLDQVGIAHCWETTQLLRAWEHGVQAEAMQRASEIFPNLVRATALTVHQECNEGDEDQEAGFTGAPFVQPAHDEEWMEYIDWGEVEAQAGGSSSSGA